MLSRPVELTKEQIDDWISEGRKLGITPCSLGGPMPDLVSWQEEKPGRTTLDGVERLDTSFGSVKFIPVHNSRFDRTKVRVFDLDLYNRFVLLQLRRVSLETEMRELRDSLPAVWPEVR